MWKPSAESTSILIFPTEPNPPSKAPSISKSGGFDRSEKNEYYYVVFNYRIDCRIGVRRWGSDLYAKKKTDDALSGLMSSIETIGEEHVLKSESGLFYTDGNGIVQRFEHAGVNPFFDEDIEKTDNYTYKTQKSTRSIVIPNGVRGNGKIWCRWGRTTGCTGLAY